MRLELSSYDVKGVRFSSPSSYSDGILSIDKEELERLLGQDPRLKAVSVELACPGEKTRIIHILDIIEPRAKVEAPGRIFPGFLGPPHAAGEGQTNRLAGVAVIETAELAHPERGVFFAREKVLDMSGPGGTYSAFSNTFNIVLTFQRGEEVSWEEYEAAIRLAGLKTATYLAELTRGLPPDGVDIHEIAKPDRDLPKVVYVLQVLSDGVLADTFLYGEPIRDRPPRLINPNEIMDGAIVNGSYTELPISTYVHCNNPVIRELYRLHEREIDFLGVVLTSGGGITSSDYIKEGRALAVAKLAKSLGADGAVITQEGGGNSIVDQMLICRSCEQLGMKTILVSYEMGGEAGIDVPLIYMATEADAVISVGSREERVKLPAMDRVLGGEKLSYPATGLDPKGSFEIFTSGIVAAVDQTGFGKLTVMEY